MKKVTENDPTKNTEINKEQGRYSEYIKNMKVMENNLTFFNQLLDKALKNPNTKTVTELQQYTENLPLSDELIEPKFK